MVTRPPRIGCPSVLVVDDVSTNLQLADRILGGAGYAVSLAASGPAALQALTEHGPFEVYMLDYMMPGMNGAELADRIRQVHADARVLYYSAFSARLFRETNGLRSDEAFLEKPASIRALREAVSLVLFGDVHGVRRQGI